MKRRFWVLRMISELLKLSALAALVLGTLGAVLAFGSEFAVDVNLGVQPLGVPQVPDILFQIVGVASFALGFVVFLVLYGISQLFYVLMAIEENTRPPRTRKRTSQEQPVVLPEPTSLAS